MSVPVDIGIQLPAKISGSVEVREGSHGRGLYAIRDIKAGDIVFSEYAVSSFVRLDKIKDFCNNCAKSLLPADRMMCSACGVVRYCSVICQHEHWPIHQLECASIKNVIH